MMPKQLEVLSRTDDTISWRNAGDGIMACAGHAVRDDDGRVWIFDPVDGDQLDDLISELGDDIAAVIVLLDRHLRGSVEVAARLDVDLWFPEGSQRQDLPALVRRYDTSIEGCPFEFIIVRQQEKRWLERAAWLPSRKLLIVAEAVGTVDYFLGGGDLELAVHPMMRAFPPTVFKGMTPERLLVGHGPPLESDATEALELALHDARRGLPRMAAHMPALVVAWAAAARDGRGNC
ncbi:MAG: hypothetical protein H7123_00595 [Thermoleophilia bacterium]|nr:hypothetical protein [Thermoleophilia bacterium]